MKFKNGSELKSGKSKEKLKGYTPPINLYKPCFEEQFPSLKDNDYCSFDQIQKDKLTAVCLDKAKVREVLDRFDGTEQGRLLKKELGLND